MEIDKNDERNIAIANHAKAKAYDIMLYVFGALMIAFALMRVDILIVLLFVIAYLLVVFLFIISINITKKCKAVILKKRVGSL